MRAYKPLLVYSNHVRETLRNPNYTLWSLEPTPLLYPAINLVTGNPGVLWRSVDLVEQQIRGEFPVELPISALVLGKHNLSTSPGMSVTWELSNTVDFTVIEYSGTWEGYSSAIPSYGQDTPLALLADKAYNVRYWRVIITDPNNPKGYISAGQLMLGQHVVLDYGHLAGASFAHKSISKLTYTYGGAGVVSARDSNFDFSGKYNLITEAEKDLLLKVFRVSKQQLMYFDPYYMPGDQSRTAVFGGLGLITKNSGLTFDVKTRRYSTGITFSLFQSRGEEPDIVAPIVSIYEHEVLCDSISISVFWDLTTEITLDWGDGTVEAYPSVDGTGNETVVHTYPSAQEYTITVTASSRGGTSTDSIIAETALPPEVEIVEISKLATDVDVSIDYIDADFIQIDWGDGTIDIIDVPVV